MEPVIDQDTNGHVMLQVQAAESASAKDKLKAKLVAAELQVTDEKH